MSCSNCENPEFELNSHSSEGTKKAYKNYILYRNEICEKKDLGLYVSIVGKTILIYAKNVSGL